MAVKDAIGARPWLTTFAVGVVVIAINVALRDFVWRYSWPNLTINLAFFSIMLGPLFGGICAWWASRFTRDNDALLRLSRRQLSVVVREVGVLWTAILLSYVVVGVILVLVMFASGGYIAHWQTFLPLVSAMLLYFGMGVIGFVVGSNWHSAWMPIVVSVGLFAMAMVLYGTSLSPLVQVGGATSTLYSLIPNWRFHLLGIFGWAVLIIGFALLFMISADRKSLWRHVTGVTAIAVACGVIWVVDRAQLNRGLDFRFVEVEADVTCEPLSSDGELCIVKGFESFRDEAEAEIAVVIEKYHEIGLDLDVTWGQEYETSDITFSVSVEGYGGYLWEDVLNYLLVSSCGPEAYEVNSLLLDGYWFSIVDFMLDETGDPELRQKASDAVEGIQQCSF